MPLEQHLEQAQKLVLTQAMQQSLQFLQMSTPELADFLQDAALSNPVLEVELPPQSQPMPEPAGRNADDLPPEFREQSIWNGTAVKHTEDADHPDFTALYAKAQSFSEYLEEQLGQMKQLDEDVRARCLYLVGCLNSIGYLDCTLSELAAETGQSQFDMEQALFVVQALDPTGVGARSLSECLLLQLAQSKEFNAVNIRLIQDGLPLLADGDYAALAKLLDVPVAEARRAADVIRRLNPIPSRGFASGDATGYIQPEAVIRCENGRVVVEMSRHVPQIALNKDYCAMAGSETCAEAQPYLKEKIAEAKSLMAGVQGRYDTISRLLNAVVQAQSAYFLQAGALQPMTMKQLADQLELNPSTVSRAVKEKYIQFGGRVFPLRRLFTAALQSSGGETVSAETARQQIKRFVAAEDPAKPLSDEALCKALSGVGISLARRTVAKYRGELNIPSASARKRA